MILFFGVASQRIASSTKPEFRQIQMGYDPFTWYCSAAVKHFKAFKKKRKEASAFHDLIAQGEERNEPFGMRHSPVVLSFCLVLTNARFSLSWLSLAAKSGARTTGTAALRPQSVRVASIKIDNTWVFDCRRTEPGRNFCQSALGPVQCGGGGFPLSVVSWCGAGFVASDVVQPGVS